MVVGMGDDPCPPPLVKRTSRTALNKQNPAVLSGSASFSIRVGRPGRVILHGKKREHGLDFNESGVQRADYVLVSARIGCLLRAIMACNLHCT